MNALDRLYIGAQIKAMRVKESIRDFFNSQDGVSNIVATILLILIVVLLIGVFWNAISGWLAKVWEKIMNNEPTKPADWSTGS